MSGHSKWSTIKRQKGVADAKRSVAFSKLSRQISLAARQGKDPAMNFKLRLAIDRARAANLPNDNIDRAIRVGAGETKGTEVKEIAYEGFGPGGVAVIAQSVTDNPNRTASDVRSLFGEYRGALGSVNSVRWMFDLRGVIHLLVENVPAAKREEITLGLIDAGAEEVQEENGELVILTQPEKWPTVKDWLLAQGYAPQSADLELVPKTTVAIDDAARTQLHELLSALEEHDDITDVYSNEA